MNLINVAVDDESIVLLAKEIKSIEECERVYLDGNNISISTLLCISLKTFAEKKFPLFIMRNGGEFFNTLREMLFFPLFVFSACILIIILFK